jgi:outer membrane receptor protein involved in Fe transport
VLVTALCLTGGTTAAQDDELEQVIVTGSRIARPDFDSASPIVSVSQELFDRIGSGTVESALNTLPQFVPAYTSTSNNPGNGGQANVDLRGLGPTSTLVLVDGKRLMPANGTGVVDLNIIPSSMVESVEIITGGASAVYGSDALAGVVNFKLKRKLEGVEIDGAWGQTDRGDGTQYEIGLTAGTEFAGGRGSVIGFVGYADRELVRNDAREFSTYPLMYAGGAGRGTLGPEDAFLPFGSSSIEEGRVEFPENNSPSADAFTSLMQSYGYAPGSVPYQRRVGFNSDGTLFTPGSGFFFGNQIPAVANFRGERDPVFYNDYAYTYNFGPVNALQLPLDRKNAFVRAEYELGDAAKIYVQGLYSDYSVSAQLAPTPLFDTLLPATNPYISDDLRLLLDSRPNPAANVNFQKRLSELGPRLGEYEYDVYQVTLGLSGSVFDDWTYDAYAQIGANDQTNLQTGNVLTSRIEELTFAPDGGVSVCGGFDPFGLESISPECLEYIAVDASNHAVVDQTIAEVSLSGPVLSLPAGDLRLAVGAFYKEDRYEYTASPFASVFLPDGRPDIQGFSASRDLRGNDHNIDVYFETLVPLLADVRGVEALEAVIGYRLSDYSPPAASIPGKRSLSTSRSMPCDCAVRTSRPFGAQRVRALPSAVAGDLRFFLFSGPGGSVCRRQPGEDRTGQRAGRGLVPRAGHTRVSIARLPGLGLCVGREERWKSGAQPGGGHDEYDRSRLDRRLSRVRCCRACRSPWTGTRSTSTTRSTSSFSPILASSVTTAGITRTSPLRTSGARCSRATLSPAG